jgi:hypothetical protein
MRSVERRIEKLEAQRDRENERIRWPAVHAASQRQTARVRMKICRLLDTDETDPRFMHAAALLVDDSPALVALDAATVHRWHRQQGILPDHGGVRQRLMQSLEAVARRLKESDRRGADPCGPVTCLR